MKLRALLALAALASVSYAQQPAATSPGIIAADIDRSVKPGDNFYLYANGNWQKREQIPADRTSISSFSLLGNLSNKRVAELIETAAKSNPAPNTDARRIADLYTSYMNTTAIEAAGLKPLKPSLDQIADIKTPFDLAHVLGLSVRADVDALNNTNYHTANIFGLWVAPSFNDPNHYAPYLLQGGLTLPDRAYYLTDSPRMKGIRDAYQKHAAKMFALAGFDQPDVRAAHVIALETAIAQAHISLADNEDIHKANNSWTLADFAAKAPGLDWKEFLRSAGIDKQPAYIVWQPTAFAGEAALIGATPLDTWKDYLTLHLLEAYGAALPQAFVDERFAFFGTVLTGAPQNRPRDQRAVLTVNVLLGEAVGKLYAARYFTPAEKAQVQAMVANLLAAFRARLEANTWMAPATKKEALAKLDTLQVGIGYPDRMRTYLGLEIKPDDLAGNLMRASLYETRFQIGRIGRPVDRKEWCMTPQTVNAVNLPLDNGLNFPAAILQPPFFDANAPAAFNYGAIGSVIGHEISHTFDSEGAAFDSEGRVRNWWTDADLAHFESSTAALAKQYDAYAPFPDLHLNGRQTLGENIADVAGLAAAYDAFQKSIGGKPAPMVDGFNGDQQFFIAYAQNRTAKAREAALRQQVLTDPHSPGEYRADTVRNLDAWYPAFSVKPGQTLYLAPDQRVRIW
jgi:endothelin-converting enzyme/putative endopeptidase